MGFQTVTWTSRTRLSCAGCAPANVILSVTESKVAEPACPAGFLSPPTNQTVQRSYVYAQLMATTPFRDSCSGTYFKYSFTYDDSQLISGASLLSSDINGAICEGALTDWVKDLVGNEILFENISASGANPPYVRATLPHGCQFQWPVPTGTSMAGQATLGNQNMVAATVDTNYDVPISFVNPLAYRSVLLTLYAQYNVYSQEPANTTCAFSITGSYTSIVNVGGSIVVPGISCVYTTADGADGANQALRQVHSGTNLNMMVVVVPAGGTFTSTYRMTVGANSGPYATLSLQNVVVPYVATTI